MSRLSNYANAAAGKREDAVTKIFTALNTKDDNFQPINLKNLVAVTPKTIYSYLLQIQDAQLLTTPYQQHIRQPFSQQIYSKGHVQSQIDYALLQYKYWNKRLNSVQQYNQDKKNTLLQYQFTKNKYNTLDKLYQRLEHSLLIYSLLAKEK